MSPGVGILIGILLLAANAFFVGAEFAAMSARRSQLEPIAEAGSKRATIALEAMSSRSGSCRIVACAAKIAAFCSSDSFSSRLCNADRSSSARSIAELSLRRSV